MCENELVNLFVDGALEKLSTSKSIMGETEIQAEIEAVIKEAAGEHPDEAWKSVTRLVNTLLVEQRKLYETALIDGIRLGKWLHGL
jgi:flagellin-specific chaperone FliS